MTPSSLLPAYTFHEKLGSGSFSEVFRATRGDQSVAIKLVRPGVGEDAGAFQSLRYEFWVLKDLNHPNIVRLFDFGELPDKRLFLVEEICVGETLDVFCAKNSFATCEPVLVQLLEGLSHLHRWHVVHGDLKPANIIVTTTPAGPTAKILDFGLANTPAFLAPEMILGQKPNHLSDLYSLGVTLYTALGGQNPFVQKRVEDTLKAHLHLNPGPLGLIRKDVSPLWAGLIHRLLAKVPAARPVSAAQALTLVSKNTFSLTPTPFIGRQPELSEAFTLVSRLKAGEKVALVVTGEPGVGVSRFLREIFYRIIGENPELRTQVAVAETTPLPDVPLLLINRLTPPATHQVLRLALKPFSRDDVCRLLEEALQVKPVPASFVDRIFGLTLGNLRSLWDLLTLLAEKKLLSDAKGRVTPSTLSLILWDELFPGPQGVQGNFDWALQQVKLKLHSRRVTEKDPLWDQLEAQANAGSGHERLQKKARILALKGEACLDEEKPERAREYFVSALEIFKNDAALRIDALRTRNFIAYLFLRQGKAREAIEEFEKTAAEIRELHPDDVQKITNLDLGLAYLQAGLYPQALKRLEEELSFHQTHADRAGAPARAMSCLYNLALVHAGLGHAAEAEKYYRQVLQKAHELVDPALILRALNGLGALLQDGDRWRESLTTYSQALEVALAIKDGLAAAAISQNKGVLAAGHGLIAEGLRDLEDSLRFLEKIPTRYTYEKTLLCRSLLEIGNIHLKQNRLEEAKSSLDRAWHLAEPDDDLKSFRFWVLLARCQAALALKNHEALAADLAELHFYADDESKKKKAGELQKELFKNRSGHTPEPTKIFSELDALLRINADLIGDIPLEELLKRILAHAIELSGAELGVILLADSKGALTPAFSLNADLTEDLCDISLSVAKLALTRGEPVTATDATEDENFNQYASVMALHLKSILGLPISFKGRILGVLYLSHRYRPALFQAQTTSVLQAFAGQAGLAMTNHELLLFHKKNQEVLKEELDETRLSLTLAQARIRSLPVIEQKIAGGPLKTRSPAVIEILDQVERIADSSLTLVIHGETGTGKELLARYLHEASPRRAKPFVAVNCGALPATLIESELFGHVRGAFTGADRDKVGLIEAAGGGTLFLDEVADLSAEAQVRLLRVLQEKEVLRVGDTKTRPVDIRVVTASHQPLRDAVEQGKFREDLYYRINGLEVTLPPLSARPEDVPLLADFFLHEALVESGRKQPSKIAAPLLKLFAKYSWPGNIRELRNVIRTGLSFSEGKLLGLEALPKYLKDRFIQARPAKTSSEAKNVGWYHPGKTWKEHELLIYVSALLALNFDMPRVALSLGVGIATVYKWLRENRIREKKEEWKKQVPAYEEGTALKTIRKTVFTQAARRHPGHPYYAAQELGVSPVTFYRWSAEDA